MSYADFQLGKSIGEAQALIRQIEGYIQANTPVFKTYLAKGDVRNAEFWKNQIRLDREQIKRLQKQIEDAEAHYDSAA